ncbi:MAG TPA: permease [Streptosporangiaceae bacterium]
MAAIGHALLITGSMAWEILWALILGFGLSAVIQALVSKQTVVRLLGDDRPRTLAVAAGLGAASSSCSYAAVALARALVRKGANFTAAMAFEIASTNLVIELGVILALLMGWQFTAAEFIGGPIMIVVVAVVFRLFLRQRLLDDARAQADRGLAGSMEGHAAMDMSIATRGSFTRRLLSGAGLTAVAHVFVMEWAAIIRDLVIGLLIAGAVAAWVPATFWRVFFVTGHPVAAALWGPVIGPVVAMLSFVCSIGNVPLAAVLWKDGLSFGGVTAFIFADLLILPILNIYRKYYGARMALFLLGSFYAAMVIAGYAVEAIFGGLGLVPARSAAKVPDSGVSWNYTTWLNIVFLLLAAVLLIRFVRTGGIPMLRTMGGSPDGSSHDHGTHHHGVHDHGVHDHGTHDRGAHDRGAHHHAVAAAVTRSDMLLQWQKRLTSSSRSRAAARSTRTCARNRRPA